MEHALRSDIWKDWSAAVRQAGDDFGATGDLAGLREPDVGAMWYSRL